VKAIVVMNPALPLELVKLDTMEQFEAEGHMMGNALRAFFTLFAKEGVTVYSVRQNNAPLLNLSVRPEGFVAHIVGRCNCRPTDEELTAVTKLLAEMGIETRYDPNSMA
jgi:hypothetical protein